MRLDRLPFYYVPCSIPIPSFQIDLFHWSYAPCAYDMRAIVRLMRLFESIIPRLVDGGRKWRGWSGCHSCHGYYRPQVVCVYQLLIRDTTHTHAAQQVSK